MAWWSLCRMHSSWYNDNSFLWNELKSSLFLLLGKHEQFIDILLFISNSLRPCYGNHMDFPSFTRVNQHIIMIINRFYFPHFMTELLQKFLIFFITKRIGVCKVNFLLFQELKIYMQLCIIFFCLVFLIRKITIVFALSQRHHYYF